MKEKSPSDETPKTPKPEKNMSRREFVATTGGFLAFLLAGRPERAAASLNEIFSGTEKEGGPKISFEIFYAPHEKREDAKGLAEKVKTADIVIPEQIGWDEKLLSIYRGIAQGVVPPEEYFRYFAMTRDEIAKAHDSYSMALLEALYKSGKRIELIDAPIGHSLHFKTIAALNNFSLVKRKNFKELVSEWKDALREDADVQKEREEYMLQELVNLQKQIQYAKIPELKDKQEIKILMTLGAYHTKVSHDLKAQNSEVSREMIESPYIFKHFDEAGRRFAFNKEVSDELVARGILELIIGSYFKDELNGISRSSYEQGLFLRRVTEHFSFDEIGELVSYVRESSPGFTKEKLITAISAKGIAFPPSKEDFKKISTKFTKK